MAHGKCSAHSRPCCQSPGLGHPDGRGERRWVDGTASLSVISAMASLSVSSLSHKGKQTRDGPGW